MSEPLEPGVALRRTSQAMDALRATHRQAVKRAALVLQGEIRRTLSQPGTGRTYKSRGVTSKLARRGTKKRLKQEHRASAPGEPPAVDTGELRRSVVINPQSDGTVHVGPAAEYAAALEYGTVRPTRSVRFRKGPSVNRKRLASVLRAASASRSLTSSVASRGRGFIAPRPFMERSRTAAEPLMTDVMVDDLKTAIVTLARRGRP